MDHAFTQIEQPHLAASQRMHQQAAQPQQSAHYRTKTASSYADMAKRNVSRNAQKSSKRAGPPPERIVTWAQRLLQPGSDQTGYTIVYMPSPRHTLHSKIRCALSVLGMAKEQVLDVHFPAHGVVGLLIQQSFEQELTNLLKQNKLSPKADFNPIAASTIGDPALLAKLNEIQRAEEAKKLYQDCMLSLCLRMPKVHLGVAIMRHFHDLPTTDHHHIGDAYMAQFQTARPKPKRKRGLVQSEEEA